MNELVIKMRKGDRRALSRLLSLVEERDERSFRLLEEVWPLTGGAKTVGITGPAGVGKSTLIDQLITVLRAKGKKVGVVAIDPSSPLTGGAVLGDRVRMQRHAEDPDVFIRSVANRGRSGGVSFSTRALVQVLDAFGLDLILVETVGVGQGEVDVVDLVDTTVVVLGPDAGDTVQTLKAGILEIADIFVVNKSDQSGAEQVAADLRGMLSLKPADPLWQPPILATTAGQGVGVAELWETVLQHHAVLATSGRPKDEIIRRRLHELTEILEARLARYVMGEVQSDRSWLDRLTKEARPNLYAVAERLFEGLTKK